LGRENSDERKLQKSETGQIKKGGRLRKLAVWRVMFTLEKFKNGEGVAETVRNAGTRHGRGGGGPNKGGEESRQQNEK